ncbi:hypothetical protein Kpho02_03260 [Kitasatospora phosalacinea]|uniref:Uncharacterized protein n=1 Tax=Kitasatospora phosalacinea TaxID=2065 RepID=A0A9W6V094_9ACTN|nr:hypothetical protein Kpho02_03260 [Kitasatospora phosalacinea]
MTLQWVAFRAPGVEVSYPCPPPFRRGPEKPRGRSRTMTATVRIAALPVLTVRRYIDHGRIYSACCR